MIIFKSCLNASSFFFFFIHITNAYMTKKNYNLGITNPSTAISTDSEDKTKE